MGGGRWENNVGGGRLVYKMWEIRLWDLKDSF